MQFSSVQTGRNLYAGPKTEVIPRWHLCNCAKQNTSLWKHSRPAKVNLNPGMPNKNFNKQFSNFDSRSQKLNQIAEGQYLVSFRQTLEGKELETRVQNRWDCKWDDDAIYDPRYPESSYRPFCCKLDIQASKSYHAKVCGIVYWRL